MRDNFGNHGGCINLKSSSLIAVGSTFHNNKAIEGGVIYASDDSTFRIQDSHVEANYAQFGSVLVAKNNYDEFGLVFDGTKLTYNYSEKNLI